MGDCSHGCCWFPLELYYPKSDQKKKGEHSPFHFLQSSILKRSDKPRNVWPSGTVVCTWSQEYDPGPSWHLRCSLLALQNVAPGRRREAGVDGLWKLYHPEATSHLQRACTRHTAIISISQNTKNCSVISSNGPKAIPGHISSSEIRL